MRSAGCDEDNGTGFGDSDFKPGEAVRLILIHLYYEASFLAGVFRDFP